MVKGGEQILLNLVLDSTEGITSTTNTRWGRSKVKDRFQALILEVDTCDAAEGGVWFKVEFEGMMEVRSIEEGVERVMAVTFKGSLTEAVG